MNDVAERDSTTGTDPAAPAGKPPLRVRLQESAGMLLVMAALGGAAVLGHHTGWKLPEWSAGSSDAPADFCAAHGVPESVCVECNSAILPRPQEFGWCGKHGVHECPLCHPEVAQSVSPVQVTPAMIARAEKALAFGERPTNSSRCKLQTRRLQFASDEAVSRAGIADAPVFTAPVVESVVANGEIVYDQTRVARLSSRTAGTVWRVERQIGDRVQPGDTLALVDSADVGRAKAEFLQAFAQVDLKERTWLSLQSVQGAIAGRSFQEAEASLREARIRLLAAQQALNNLGLPVRADELKALPDDRLVEAVQFLGLPEALVRKLDPRTTTGNLLPIKSPNAGMVVSRDVVAGDVIDASRVLLVIADNQQLWLNLAVRLEDAALLGVGQTVLFRPDGSKEDLRGSVTWISTAIDQQSRTVRLRADLPNPAGKLRAGTFGAGRIILRAEPNAVVVPKEALHHEGCCHVVFVRDKDWTREGSPKVFHVRKVVPGANDGTNVEIIAGLLPGEVVAAKGSGILRGELLKNHLGTGCGCGH